MCQYLVNSKVVFFFELDSRNVTALHGKKKAIQHGMIVTSIEFMHGLPPRPIRHHNNANICSPQCDLFANVLALRSCWFGKYLRHMHPAHLE
jgi:hypothetical protein